MGIIIALLISLGTCIVRIHSVRVQFACTQRLFNLSAEAIIPVRTAPLRASCTIFLLTNEQIRFFMKFDQGISSFGAEKSLQDVIGDVYCPTYPDEKCVYLSTDKSSGFHDSKECKTCSHVLNPPFKDQKPTTMLVGCDGTHCFKGKTNRDYGKEKPARFLRKFIHQSDSSTPKSESTKANFFPFMAHSCRLPIG